MVLDTLRRSASARRLPLCVSLHRPAAYRFVSLIMSARRLLIDNAKVQHFSCDSKFYPSIWGSFQHEFDEFERTVISRPQIRNFRASKITFRRFRAGWGISLPHRHFVTLPH